MTDVHLVRMCCPKCGHHRGGSIDRDDDGELHIRWTSRRKMRGTDRAEAERWEFGGVQRAPMSGEPPSGARIFAQRFDRYLWDPRNSEPAPDVSHLYAAFDPADHPDGGPIVYYSFKAYPLTFECPKCMNRLSVSAESVAQALDEYDQTGDTVDLDLDPSPQW